VARRLNAAAAAGEVSRLYLIAEPSFLGLLRQRLDKAALAAVVQEQASDLTRRPVGDIRKVLPARF
jgi:protein required for attachment to host cells